MTKRICSLAVLLGLVVTASAQRTIAYFNGPSFQIFGAYGPREIDVNNDRSPDFLFWESGPISTTDIPPSGFAWPFYVGAVATNQLLAGDYALAQPLGSCVSDNPPSGASWTTPGFGALLTAFWSDIPCRAATGPRLQRH